MRPYAPAVPVVLAMLLGIGSSARAQDFTFPTTGALNNYDRVQVGQHEALEAGAFIARTGDAGAAWYNPAGLALVENSSVNASANAYEFTRASLEGLGNEVSRTRFTPVGRYFGVVIGAPIIKNRDVRLGISFAKPVGWAPGAIDAATEFAPAAGGTEVLNLYSHVSFDVSMPSVTVGYRVSDVLRLGAGLTYSVTSLSVSQELGDRWLQPTGFALDARNLETDGSTSQVLLSLGAQWEPTAHLRLGINLRTPGARLGGSSSVTFSRSIVGNSTNRDLFFRDRNARFEYHLPLYVGAGVAWVEDGWEAEFNARFYGAPGDYAVLSSPMTAQVVEQAAGDAPVVRAVAFPDVVQENRAIVNLAVGGSIRLSPTFRLHAGFFTDNSPNARSGLTVFRTLDMIGGSLGASATVGKLSGSLGVTASSGTSTSQQIGPSLSGTTASTRLTITTVSVVYALSITF